VVGDQVKTPRKEEIIQQRMRMQQNAAFNGEELKTGRENLESSPDLGAKHAGLYVRHSSTPVFISPKKKTILRKQETANVPPEDIIYGNCLFAGVYMPGFKIQMSMSQHTYSSGIEAMFQMQLDSIAKIMENSDKIYSITAFKELMHRKGLNLRFSWILLGKVKL
jgi:hypothetical protein